MKKILVMGLNNSGKTTFSKQLAYEIRKPAYLQDDSFVAMFTINEFLPD